MTLTVSEPSLSHRFLVSFFIKRIPSPLDCRFQRVSGLSREMSMMSLREGGDNLGNVSLPERVVHGTLRLERGVIPVTPVTSVFDYALGHFANVRMDVVVMLLNEEKLPVSSWTVSNALPVRWETGELDATSNTVLVDTLELAYNEMHWFGIRG
ncbi:TPA: phage tail protein [Burkholderia orbicola]